MKKEYLLVPHNPQENNPAQEKENEDEDTSPFPSSSDEDEYYDDEGSAEPVIAEGESGADTEFEYVDEEGEYEALREMVEFIARTLASNPDEVQVTEVRKRQQVVFQLRAAEEDKGKIIGKNGRVAEAVRSILKAASVKLQTRAMLEIK